MPRLNGTGPEGKGSQTGRGLGKCNPKNKDLQTESGNQARQGRRGADGDRGMGQKNRRRGESS